MEENDGGAFGGTGLDVADIKDAGVDLPYRPERGRRLRAGWGQQLDLALADCQAALKTDPASAAFLDSRGLVNLRLGKLDAAVADYDAALKTSPRLATSLYGRGLAKLKKGDGSGGRADLAAARALHPDVVETFDRFGLKP